MIALSLLLPLAAVTVIALAGVCAEPLAWRIRRTTAILSPVTVLPAAALSLTGTGQTLEVPWLLFGASFAVDSYARALTLIAALLYGAALMAVTWVKLKDAERGSGALSGFLLVCFTGNIGTYLAADAVSFYFAFALMSFSAAALVVHYRTDSARRATRIYLVMSVLSETAILAAFLLIAAAGGALVAQAPAAVASSEHTGAIVTLLLIGFGVKAGTVPLHVWLPLAHPAAPPAASAVLSGAMVKAGMIGWLRFLPLGEAPVETAGGVLMVLALVGAFAAALIGVLQKDPKVVLAYSTISQMGFIAALIAVGLLAEELAAATATAAVLYAVHHGLAKGALFLGLPVVKHYGRGASGVLVVIGLAGAGLAVAGAPLTSGAFGKYVSKETVEGIDVAGVGLDHLLPLVATGSTVLLLRFGWVLLAAERQARRGVDGELISWLLVCAAGVAVPWVVGIYWLDAGTFSWEPGPLWDMTWPILLGLGMAVGVWAAARSGVLPHRLRSADGSAVQPGDLIVAEESLAVRSGHLMVQGTHRVHTGAGRLADRLGAAVGQVAESVRSGVGATERRLSGWEASGVVMMVLLSVAVVVVARGWLW
ncbi:proton-conducting transporter membrane subunit [Nesterenkonia alba]|uniref:proton-conducting transporter transmembrane domain-containing protein n=1 Tax=Nesterenkonia alba TaxID=515814 RepID=UPI0003B756FF|nr:proton-conducting transporter membrane subunit [Nesterenkonia alba]